MMSEEFAPHSAGPWSTRLRTEPAKRLLRTIWMTMAAFFIWAALFSVDRVTHAQGRVIPSLQNQVVQHLEGGIVTELKVREGDRVRKGDLLMRISNEFTTADVNNARTDVVSMQIALARLEAETRGDESFKVDPALAAQSPDMAKSEEALFVARRNQLLQDTAIFANQAQAHRSEIDAIQQRLKNLASEEKIQRERLTLIEGALAADAASRSDMLDRRSQLEQLRTRISDAATSLPQVRAQAAEVESRRASAIAQFVSKSEEAAAKLRVDLAKAREGLTAFNDREDRTDVRAPMDGLINKIIVQTVGGVVRGGDPLMEIVPTDNTVMIEARLRPQDRGDVWAGQSASIKVTAYDSAVHGALPANVVEISPDAIQDQKGESYFRVRLRADASKFGIDKPVMPGMTANVDIRAGKRTILAYLAGPVERLSQNALRD
jgi:adhesin transport system membrane fusion protein